MVASFVVVVIVFVCWFVCAVGRLTMGWSKWFYPSVTLILEMNLNLQYLKVRSYFVWTFRVIFISRFVWRRWLSFETETTVR